MTGFLKRLATRIDTWGGARRMKQFRTGWPATASPNVGFFQTKKAQYRYLVAGEGPTIVFSADPPMTLEQYGPLLETFAPKFRVVVFELAAMGFSAANGRYGFGFQETNDDIALFLEDVAGPGAILAFSCAASLVALDIAGRYPELVSRLTLIQGGDAQTFSAWKASRDPKGLLGAPVLGQIGMARMAPKRLGVWLDLSVGRREMLPNFCACAKTSLRHGALWSLASAFQNFMEDAGPLPAPTQPLLSIWGAADGSHPAAHAHSLSRLRPDLATATYDDLGHFPELEDPDRVFAEILRFLKDHPAAAASLPLTRS